MSIIYLHTNLHMHDYNGSLVNAAKPKHNYNFHSIATYTVQRSNIDKGCIFFDDLLPYDIPGSYIKSHSRRSILRSSHSVHVSIVDVNEL
jgi:hypothetical protein